MEFGQRVKQLRRAKHLTKEDFCEDETELSVRQLTRIESGLSLPTLAKVVFIAKRLGVTVGDLADEERFELPKRYKEIKYTLLRTQTFASPERISLKENYFNEIFDYFYDDLPEEEQLVVDILESSLKLSTDNESFAANKIVSDYLEQTLKKSIYSTNDLILINLYLINLKDKNFSQEVFDHKTYNKIVDRVTGHIELLELNNLFLLHKPLIHIFGNAVTLNDKNNMRKSIETLDTIVSKTLDFQQKPLINLMKWKFHLFQEPDVKQAETYYQEALMFAQVTKETELSKKLEEEWLADLSVINKS